jgi:CheY-like chemotaxis protein
MATIMIVNDAEAGRRSMTKLLRGVGYQTVSACSPVAAEQTLEGGVPELVLIDVRMPELDGVALLETLHDDPRWSRLPVVVLVAASDTHCIRLCRQRESQGYPVKAAFSLLQTLDQIGGYAGGACHPTPD